MKLFGINFLSDKQLEEYVKETKEGYDLQLKNLELNNQAMYAHLHRSYKDNISELNDEIKKLKNENTLLKDKAKNVIINMN